MNASTLISGGDPVLRRAMFALELVDPVTGTPMGGVMEAKAEGLSAPSVTRAGQLVWRDIDPPADRSIKVTATAKDKRFAPYEEVLAIPKRTPDTPPAVVRRKLQPTGLYQPPSGRLGVAGMLITDAAARDPIAGAQIVLVLAHGALVAELRSALVAVSDDRGGFVAVAAAVGGERPKSALWPGLVGSAKGWLEVTVQGALRKTPDLTLRQDRLNYLPKPLIWADLTP